ncbi:N-formimino-L-glutamate deiminase [compost metagenome]
MIGRQRVITRRQAGTVQGRQLLGVQFHRQTEFLCSDEHPLDLGRRKRQVLAERIHRIHQPFGCQCRKHFAADMVDVVVGAVGILRRQGVSGQAGAAHADRQFGAKTTDHPQDFPLAGQVQTITGLHLDAGHTVTQQAFQALGGTGKQFVLARCASRTHGAGNATTGGCDLGITDAL